MGVGLTIFLQKSGGVLREAAEIRLAADGAPFTEEIRLDRKRQPRTRSFGDYVMPSARDVPVFDVLLLEEAPNPINPLGAKGAGEGGINAAGALAAAVEDAFDGAFAPRRLPMTPRYLFNQHQTLDASQQKKGYLREL